jgi:hypothetical protein
LKCRGQLVICNNYKPEVFHKALKVLLQKLLAGDLEDGQGHQKYGFDALQEKDVENAENLLLEE